MFYNIITRNGTLVLKAISFVLLYLFLRGQIMTDLIRNYTHSRILVKKRIDELLALRKSLLERGESLRAEQLDLDRRIRLLYTEHLELMEDIAALTSYQRRREESVKA